MNRIVFLAVLLPLICVQSLFSATLSNRYLLIDVDDETGRLFMSTRGSLEQVAADEQRILLFYDVPPASYTLIYVDGDLFTFGGDRGAFLKRPVVIGNYIQTRWGNDLIHVDQVVQWVEREDTGLQDGVLVRYEIENRSKNSIDAGLRILLDTYQGEQETSHFLLDDGTEVEYEWERTGDDIPSWWESRKGNGQGPCLRGSLTETLVTVPQRVMFANYRSLLHDPYEHRIRRNRRFHSLPYSRNDSAVALFYGPVDLEPGGTVEFATILGLCGEGRYVLKADKTVYEEVVLLPVLSAILEAAGAVSREEAEMILRELENIRIIRGDLDKINELIAELNEALEGGAKQIGEERLGEIRRLLREIAGE